MIEINLLPIELRERKRISFKQIFKGTSFKQMFKAKLVFAILGCLVLFHLLLHIVAVINAKRLYRLERAWQSLSSKREQVDQLNNELARINKRIPLIEQLIGNRVLWSRGLNRVNDLIIPGIWLNGLTVEKQKTETKLEPSGSLIIRGSAASRTKDEPALIGRFMQNLKDDPSFSADFAEIELGPIKKRQIAQTEVMDFVLICRFKPEKAEALVK